jgi:hypothetical protein
MRGKCTEMDECNVWLLGASVGLALGIIIVSIVLKYLLLIAIPSFLHLPFQADTITIKHNY